MFIQTILLGSHDLHRLKLKDDYDLISKFQIGLKSLLRQGLSETEFYGDLAYQFKTIVGSYNFSAQFINFPLYKDWL